MFNILSVHIYSITANILEIAMYMDKVSKDGALWTARQA